MKITDYQKTADLVKNNVFLIDGDGGTKTIFAKDLLKALNAVTSASDGLGSVDPAQLEEASAIETNDKFIIGSGSKIKAYTMKDSTSFFNILESFLGFIQRRTIFRGASLGSTFTSEQKNNIANGSFKGFFVGDYWDIGSYRWRIVDINYWRLTGETSVTEQHLVIMPDQILYGSNMNSSGTTEGGYVGSEMYTKNLEQAKTIIYSAFGEEYILEHRENFINAVTNGIPSGGIWVNSKIDLPNEIQMYGSMIQTAIGNKNSSDVVPYTFTIDKAPLALMNMYMYYANPTRQSIWLRDVVSSANFAVSGATGGASSIGANTNLGVRPVFGLKGTA